MTRTRRRRRSACAMPSPMSGWARRCWRCCHGSPTRRSAKRCAPVASATTACGRSTPTATGTRAPGWMLARALPRAALMLLAAGIVLPLVGLDAWAWQPPAGVTAALLFIVSLALMIALATAVLMLANVVVAASLNERGVNAVLA